MKVVFILKGDPFSWKAHEALRVAVAVGINHEVDFVFIRDGVYAITDWSQEDLGVEPFDKFYETMEMVNVRLIAEDASLQERGLKESDLPEGTVIMSAEEIRDLIAQAEAVFAW